MKVVFASQQMELLPMTIIARKYWEHMHNHHTCMFVTCNDKCSGIIFYILRINNISTYPTLLISEA